MVAPTDIVIIGGYGNRENENIDVIRLKDNDAELSSPCRFPNFPTEIKEGTGVVTQDDDLIICVECCSENNKCYQLNHSVEIWAWDEIRNMSNIRWEHATISIQNQVFSIGGHDYPNYSNSAEVFKMEHWQKIESLPKALVDHCAVELDRNTIMVIGGLEGAKVLIYLICSKVIKLINY